jgi:DNA repair exonuclease SbcCD ATPase subunit
VDLRELRVQHLPGITTAFTLPAEPGLNLVLGPNGSGKSSLTRAALGLLWPDRYGGGVVEGLWDDEGVHWFSRRAGGDAVTWQRDGESAEPPQLPGTRQAAAFQLGVLDLLKDRADDDDAELARAVRRHLAGGYDLVGLTAGLSVTGREGLTEKRRLDEAQQEVRRWRQSRRELGDQEARLEGLRIQRQAAHQARDRAEALGAALALVEAREAASTATRQLAERFPATMADLRPDGWDRLVDRRARSESLERSLAEAESNAGAARTTIASTGLGEQRPERSVLEACRDRLQRARAVADRLAEATRELAAAEAAAEAARQALAPWGEPAANEAADPAELRAAAARAGERLRLSAQEAGIQDLLDREELRDPGKETGDPARYAAARRLLHQWLAASHERRFPWLSLGAAVALVAVGLLAPGAWPAVWLRWVVVGVGAAFATLALGLYLARPGTRRARDELAASDVDPPNVWTPPVVRSYVEHLIQGELDGRHVQLKAALRQQLQREQERWRSELADLGGDAPDALLQLDLAERLHRGAAYEQARARVQELIAHREQLAAEVVEQRDRIVDDLGNWLPADHANDDLSGLTAAVDDLQQRVARHEDAVRDLDDAQRRQTESAQRLTEVRAEIDALFASQELASDQDQELRRRVESLPAYEQLSREVADARAAERLREDELARLAPPLRELAEEATDAEPAGLRDELAESRDVAASLGKLDRDIVRIETRVAEATGEAAFDAAIAARDEIRRTLLDLREDVRDVAVRRHLLRRLEQQHRRLVEPPVLARARQLLLQFTAGRYELLVADDDESFRALDTASGEGLPLTALSDGTRAQLLLAARLAHLGEAERGPQVPLFLDESLTASDPVRFAAIAGAILDLVETEGRQVFYLTCDPADVAAWQQARARRDLPPAPVVDLVELRDLAAAAPVERLRPDHVEPDPPQPGMTAPEYAARLGVPALDPHRPATAAHPLHLLPDDLELVHDLAVRGITTVGQLAVLGDVLEADGLLTTARRSELAARERALSVFLDEFRVGRGRPVPAGELSRQKALSSSKLAEVDALLGELDGDAARLLDALDQRRVARFREDKQDELETWLRSQGYLDPRPARDRDTVATLVMRSARDQVGRGQVDVPTLKRLLDAWWTAAGR